MDLSNPQTWDWVVQVPHIYLTVDINLDALLALRQSFRDHLADDVDYENVGLTHSRGLAEALGLIENFMPGLDWIDVDILSIAEDGDKVLTERIDDLRAADGSLLASLRVMGIFEVRDGKIAAWRDYFDTSPFRAGS